MSDRTATRTAKALTLAAAALAWGVAAWLLSRTSGPSLDLGGLDANREFSAAALRHAAHYAHGWQALWLAGTAAQLVALVVLARRVPPRIRATGLGRVGAAILAATAVAVTLWFVSLPLRVALLWWDHPWDVA